MSALEDLRSIITADFAATLPDLKSCEIHPGKFDEDELKKFVVQAPAVRVAVMDRRLLERRDIGLGRYRVNMVAVIATQNAVGLDADVAAIRIADELQLRLLSAPWVRDAIGPPEDISDANLYNSQGRGRGGCMWALTWGQELWLCAPDEAEPVASEVYLGQPGDPAEDRELIWSADEEASDV